MLNFIRDFLYHIGLYKNELCDYVLQSKENQEIFLSDLEFLEKRSQPKLKFVKSNNFEDAIEAMVKTLEKG